MAAGTIGQAAADKDDVRDLIRRYEQVEEQLARSVHYSKKETSGDETTLNQAWFNGAGDLIKVATEKTTPGNRELTEYFSTKFGEDEPMFILSRKEGTQADGTIQIDEARQYFDATGELIRELRKSGKFKAGESLDTAHLKNVTVDLSKKPKDERSDVERAQARNEFFGKPTGIASSLETAGPPDVDPFANVTGDSEKYRIIEDTVSPDGRYGIALGLPEGKTDWEEYRDKELEGQGEQIYTLEEDGNRNYVVDLLLRKIVGITGGDYFGTKQRYNMRECEVFWSPDSKTFVELTTWKWGYNTCRAAKIAADGKKLIGNVDVGKYAEKVASNYLKTHKNAGRNQGTIAISLGEVGSDGSMLVEVIGQEASGERKGDTDFSIDEQLRLRETPSGLHLETMSVRKSSEQE
jgi:hypothetical protein